MLDVAVGDDILGFFGNAAAVATGTLGGVAGSITGGTVSLVQGRGLSGFAEGAGQGFTAGAAFSPWGSLGNEARDRYRASGAEAKIDEAIAATPGGPPVHNLARIGFDILTPPSNKTQATLDTAFFAIPGGKSLRGGSVSLLGFLGREGERVTTRSAERSGTRLATHESVDLVDNLISRNSPAAAEVPLAGRAGTRQFPHAWTVTKATAGSAAVVATAAYGPSVINSFGDALNRFQQNLGAGAGGATEYFFSGLGSGLGNLFSGLFGGAGEGAAKLGGGVSEGAKSLILPALLVGGGFLLFTALSGTARRSRA